MTLKNILVPIDFSETSDQALAYAQDLAAQFEATLHLLHVVRDPFDAWATGVMGDGPGPLTREVERGAAQRLDQLVAGDHRQHAITRIGQPHAEILEYVRTHSVDLIVMGTHGFGGIEHLVLGSVAEKVVRAATCPVLTVRSAVV